MKKKDIILDAENISKQYRLGVVGTGTLSHDINRWWHKIRGKEDPYLRVGESNDRSIKGQSDYVWALRDINFEVERGEVLGIIGENGAGKSTLLKILSRVTTPTTGIIKSKGKIASLLEVGTGFNPELTGRENIYLNGAILGMTKVEITSKIDQIIDFSGCERYIDTPTKRYSSGMTVRLAFAVAAFLEPEILVVDEVLAVGDAEFQRKAIGKIQDISHGEGRTVLFVSHDMTAISALSSSVLILNNGTCSEKIATNEGIEQYLKLERTKKLHVLKRKSDGEIFVEKILINNEEEIQTQISAGSPIKLRFEFNKAINQQDAKSIAFYVVFKNELNYPIFTISNRYDKNYIVDNGIITAIECNLPSFLLVEGRYKGTTWMSYKGGFADEIKDAIEIDIISSDFFSTGQMPVSRKHGPFLMPQIWKAN
ncbi:ABC transporter ATP-binding protein [Flavobacterium oreochromis]|uniref:ABC transporter ATP-binding protein n=1 Tax=Flavobacterium oreochromis TaxID=2906078 RepID=UPI00385B82DA